MTDANLVRAIYTPAEMDPKNKMGRKITDMVAIFSQTKGTHNAWAGNYTAVAVQKRQHRYKNVPIDLQSSSIWWNLSTLSTVSDKCLLQIGSLAADCSQLVCQDIL